MCIKTSVSSSSVQPWRRAIFKWSSSSGQACVVVSVTTQIRARVLWSIPGRDHNRPKTASAA